MSALVNSEKALIFRIVHRDNLPWIVENGLHCRKSTTVDPNFRMDAVNRAYDTKIDITELKKQKEKLGIDFKELSDKYVEERKTDSGMYM